jgi:hypothetical protein
MRRVDSTQISVDHRLFIGGSDVPIIMADNEAALVGTGFRDSLGK